MQKFHPQSLIWYHSESDLAPAPVMAVDNLARSLFQPIVIFNVESEITLWAVCMKNADQS